MTGAYDLIQIGRSLRPAAGMPAGTHQPQPQTDPSGRALPPPSRACAHAHCAPLPPSCAPRALPSVHAVQPHSTASHPHAKLVDVVARRGARAARGRGANLCRLANRARPCKKRYARLHSRWRHTPHEGGLAGDAGGRDITFYSRITRTPVRASGSCTPTARCARAGPRSDRTATRTARVVACAAAAATAPLRLEAPAPAPRTQPALHARLRARWRLCALPGARGGDAPLRTAWRCRARSSAGGWRRRRPSKT